MTNISSAMNHALAGLSVSAAQSALVARNVTNAGDENYTRKSAAIETLPGGAPMVSAFTRSTDRQLLENLLLSSSDAAAKTVTLDALTRMGGLIGDPADSRSIAAGFGTLQRVLLAYEDNPANAALGRESLEAARNISEQLNQAAGEASRIRSDAEAALSDSVERIGSLLAQFKVVNDSVVRGQGTAGELSESLDQRDAILKQLSDEIGIRTVIRPNNGISIYAEGGAVLFDGSPRAVRFTTTGLLPPGLPGGAVTIDGVAVTGEGAPMPISGGKLAALADVRDRLTLQFSGQLDRMAAGLIRNFAESDPSSPAVLPEVEGLFVGASGTLPPVHNPPPGLAAQIGINPLADPQAGGSILLIRDGGFGGNGYVRNLLGQPGYQARLAELTDSFERLQNFGLSEGVGGTVSIKELSIQSSSWIEATRQTAQRSLDLASAARTRANDSLARVTGVNIDQEMAILLDLEKSYQASSKVLTTIDAMLSTFMAAIR